MMPAAPPSTSGAITGCTPPPARSRTSLASSTCVACTRTLWEIETDEGFSLEDLMAELGRLELQALGQVKHGDVPREGSAP